jgi:hypothetical protein
MDGSDENRPWYQQFLPSFFFSKGAEDGDEMIRVDADPEPSPMAVDRHGSSIFMYMATIAMFGGPLVHANRLREISLDQIVNKKLLVRYTGKMVAEWRDVALYVGRILWVRKKPANPVLRSREPYSLVPMYRSWPFKVLTKGRRVKNPKLRLSGQAIFRS